jgi:2-polyprenyl-6-methoxyphenol hydroxylase-like FAD-dependent oxidoreductase
LIVFAIVIVQQGWQIGYPRSHTRLLDVAMQHMRRGARRAIVVGGSMSGLFCALYLRARGWDVQIFERSPVPLTGRGAGIMTHREMHEALTELGIDSSRDFGIFVDRRLVLDPAGGIIAERHRPQTATSWNRLFELLSAAFGPDCYHLGRELHCVSQTADDVTAHLADGSTHIADLLIGADGFRSAVRAQFLPDLNPVYAGYVAWRGLAGEQELVGVLPPELFTSFVFVLPPHEQFLGYPVAGPGNDLRPGHRSWNIVWYRPADEIEDVPRMLTDENGRRHELSIPPPLIARNVVAEMREASERLLPFHLRAAMRRIEQPFLQPIYDLESPGMAFGRVAVIGDAAFVIRPHVGGGVAKAAADASALTAALAQAHTVEAGLRAFESERAPVGRSYVAQARRLGSYIAARPGSAEEQARAAFYADPHRVLAETASLEFLHAS